MSALVSREDLKSVLALQDKDTPEDANYKIGDTIHTLLGGCVPAQYQVYGVNTGGYGVIYTVLDQDTLTPHCLKTARPRFLDDLTRADRLKQEARTWLQLGRHPNIVYAHSLLEINGYKSILLEYVPGGDLSWRIRKGALQLNRALNYGIQFCRGMRHADTMIPGFIHGDIKPGNCLLTESDTLKITDFGHVGRSRTGNAPRGRALPTRKEDLESYAGGGTPSYMAPELFDGSSSPDSRIDVYAFGIMLYEMITGHRPFPGRTYEDCAEQHRSDTYLAPTPIGAEIPQRLSDLIASCIAQSPEKRPQDFCVIEEVLSSILWELGQKKIPLAPSEGLSAADLIDRGSSFIVLALFDEALTCFNSVLDSNPPQSPLALNYKAQALFNCERDSEAEKCLEQALNLNPRLALTWNNKGQALNRLGNNQEALACFDRAVALDPRLSFAWSNKGRVLAELGRLRAASKSLKRALSIDPYQATAHNNQGIIFYKQGLSAEALASFKKAISLNPRLADAYSNLGDTNGNLGLPRDAIEAYRQALKFTPGAASVREKLRLAYREVYSGSPNYLGEHYATRLVSFLLDFQTDFELVLKSGLDLLRISVFDPVVLNLSGAMIYHALEELDEIEGGQREAWAEALDLVRNNSFSSAENQQTSYWIGKIFYGLDLYHECTKVFQQSILRWGPDDLSVYYVAACDEVSGRYAEALENYRQALLLDPRCHLTRAAFKRVESKLASLAVKQSSSVAVSLVC